MATKGDKTILEVETKFSTTGIDAVTAEATRLDAALDQASISSQKLDADLRKVGQGDPGTPIIASLEKIKGGTISASLGYQRLVRALDEVGAAQQKHLKNLADIDRFRKQGQGDAEQHARMQAASQERLNAVLERQPNALRDAQREVAALTQQYDKAGHAQAQFAAEMARIAGIKDVAGPDLTARFEAGAADRLAQELARIPSEATAAETAIRKVTMAYDALGAAALRRGDALREVAAAEAAGMSGESVMRAKIAVEEEYVRALERVPTVAKEAEAARRSLAQQFDAEGAALERYRATMQKVLLVEQNTSATAQELARARSGAQAQLTADLAKIPTAAQAAQAAVARLASQYDALDGILKRVAADQAQLAAAEKAGMVGPEQAARMRVAMAQTTEQALLRSGKAGEQASKGFGLAGHQLTNLSFQLNDLAVQIASGGGIFLPLIQQGAQVVQILQMSEGGIGGGLKQLVGMLKQIPPAAVGIAALGAAFVGAAVALESYLELQKDLERVTTTGLGRTAGASAEGIQKAAERASEASSLSTAEARGLAVQFTKTGKIGAEMFTDLAVVTERYARTTGQTLEEAGQEITAAFSDPARGADELDKKLNFLSATQRRYILDLTIAGDKLGAQRALMDALNRGPLVEQEKQIRTLGDAYDYLAKKMKDVADAGVQSVGKTFAPTDAEMLQNMIKNLNDQQARGRTNPRLEENILNLQEQARRRGAAGMEATRDARAQEQIKTGDRITAEVIPDLGKIDSAREKLLALEDAIREVEKRGESYVGQLDNMNAAHDRLKTGLELLGKPHEVLAKERNRMIEQGQLEVEAIMATTVAEQARVAGLQAYNQTLLQTNDATLAKIAQTNAENVVMAQSEATLRQMIMAQEQSMEMTRLESSLIGSTNIARDTAIAKLQAEQQLVNMGVDVHSRLGQQYIENAQNLAAMNAELQQEQQLHSIILGQLGQLEVLEAKISGASNREIAMIRQRNQLEQAGIDLNSERAQQSISLAGQIADAEDKLAAKRARYAAQRKWFDDEEMRRQKAISDMRARMAAREREPQPVGSFGTTTGMDLTGGSGPGRVTTDTIMAMRAAAVAMSIESKKREMMSGGGETSSFSGGGGTRLSPSEIFRLTGQMPAAEAGEEPESIDLSDLLDPVRDKISELTDKQTAIMNRAYRPDPYAEKNPELFYSGDRIYRETQDKQYTALQDQIDQLENVNSNIGTLVSQGQILPGALTTSMIAALQAAGFADIGQQIASAMTPTPAATPVSTSVQSGTLANKSGSGSNVYSASTNVPWGF